MFAIFSLRRPNILPVGDLGVQRGVLRWVLSQHTSPSSPLKLDKKDGPDDPSGSNQEDGSQPMLMNATHDTTAAVGSMMPPQTPTKKKSDQADLPIPPPFTPSIDRVLKAPTRLTPLPSGTTVANLRSRLNGKNKVK
jgi:DNA-3-methyladenine glycosylase II